MTISDIQRHFEMHAGLVKINVNGLHGLTIYSDSQFLMEWGRAGFPEHLQPVARQAFLCAIHRRVADEFPNHPLAKFSCDYLANASAKAAA